jgi:transcriptional regulator with XRE-family HTH domain
MNRLKEIRTKKGKSQLDLSKSTNIAPTDISRIENGWLKPYPSWKKRLADSLEVSENYLFPEEKAR